MNLPNFGCFPGIRVNNNGSCSKEASNFVKLHNKAFSKAVMKLEQELEGFKYSLFDLEANLRHRINHPSKYGKFMLFNFSPVNNFSFEILLSRY